MSYGPETREQASLETIAEKLSALPELLDFFAERHPVGVSTADGMVMVVCSDGAAFTLEAHLDEHNKRLPFRWVEQLPVPGTVAALKPNRPVAAAPVIPTLEEIEREGEDWREEMD